MKKIVLNPNCSELVMRFSKEQFPGMTKDKLLRELDKIGIIEIERLENFWVFDRKQFREDVTDKEIADFNTIKNILVDKDNPNSPDYEYHSSIRIEDHFGGYLGEEDTLAIVINQHSQHQLFPTVDKIASHFRVDVIGFDGGSEAEFSEWLEKGKPEIPDYNERYKERRTELLRKHTTEVPSGERSKKGDKLEKK